MPRPDASSKRIDLGAMDAPAAERAPSAAISAASALTSRGRNLLLAAVLGAAAVGVWYFTSGDDRPAGAPVVEVIGGAPAPGPAQPSAPGGGSISSQAAGAAPATGRAPEPTHTPSGEPIVVPLKRRPH